MHTQKTLRNYEITEIFNRLYDVCLKPSERHNVIFFDKITKHIMKEKKKHSLPLKIKIVNELTLLLSCTDSDIDHATKIFRNLDVVSYKNPTDKSGNFKNLRCFWTVVAKIFADDPQIKNIIDWENPGIGQPELKSATIENYSMELAKNSSGDIIFSFIPENFTKNDIVDMFPRLSSLGTCEFGEDADMCGDTLEDVIQDASVSHNRIFQQQVIDELKILLSYTDEDIARASRSLIRISPTEEVEEPPNWGRFPSLRAFWTAVLGSFENNVAMQNAEGAEHSLTDITDSAGPGCNATPPAPQS
ncbi:MAG: hypothetical protein ABF785_08205 [Acetobacter papayae]|uniref:hypothetical protein n=1 Tax=Acetobacter papayae TaxID=1076592 RepID=UPI0039EB21A4